MTPDATLRISLTKIENSLLRIAHVLEAMAKESVPNFKTLGENEREDALARRPAHLKQR